MHTERDQVSTQGLGSLTPSMGDPEAVPDSGMVTWACWLLREERACAKAQEVAQDLCLTKPSNVCRGKGGHGTGERRSPMSGEELRPALKGTEPDTGLKDSNTGVHTLGCWA